MKIIRFILQTVEPIHPYNNLKILWDMIHFSVILILLFLIPIHVCFKIELENRAKIPILAFLIVDLLLNFTTSYFNKGFIVKNRKVVNFPDLYSDRIFGGLYFNRFLRNRFAGLRIIGVFENVFFSKMEENQ